MHLCLVVTRYRAMNVRCLRRAKGREEQRTKQGKAAAP